MSRSTKLTSAAYILSFIAARGPKQVTTDTIAEALEDHPARVRQIVAALVKAKLLKSVRGVNGGVVLARSANDITLRDVFSAIEDQPILSLWMKDAYEGWGKSCLVHPILTSLINKMERDLADQLSEVPISALYKRAAKSS